MFKIKSVRSRGIKNQVKAQFDDQQRMPEEKTAKPSGEGHSFTDANEEGFEIGAFGMSRASTRRALCFPLIDNGPIEQATGKLTYSGSIKEEGDDAEVDEDTVEAELTITNA